MPVDLGLLKTNLAAVTAQFPHLDALTNVEYAEMALVIQADRDALTAAILCTRVLQHCLNQIGAAQHLEEPISGQPD